MSSLDRVYETRFDAPSRARKAAIWAEVAHHLQQYVVPSRPVLDLACDEGYFIRAIVAPERWATDVRDVAVGLPEDVTFVQADGLSLGDVLPAGHFGTVFTSNYLEHVSDAGSVIEQLRIVAGLLQPGGRIIILQPNVRLVGGRYWDYIDHRVPLTERSLEEAALVAGFRTVRLVTRFLPYSTRSRIPQDPRLVRLYLRVPLAWRILGKQTLYVGERP